MSKSKVVLFPILRPSVPDPKLLDLPCFEYQYLYLYMLVTPQVFAFCHQKWDLCIVEIVICMYIRDYDQICYIA